MVKRKSNNNFRKLPNESFDKANSNRKPTSDKAERLIKLKAIITKLKHEKIAKLSSADSAE